MSQTQPGDGLASIRSLVEGFRANLRSRREEQAAEAEIRQEYVDPFWHALGWDVGNTAHRSDAEKDVVIERTIDTIEAERVRARRPDYLFRIDGFARFVVEAKKPGLDLHRDLDAIFQAKTYAWSAQIPFAILTDFEKFRLFDATVKPAHGEPERGLVGDFDLGFADYPTQWETLWETFSREAVATGSLERLLARIKHLKAGRRIRGIDRAFVDLRGSEPVDRVFLEHLEAYRLRFASAIYKENKGAFPEAETHHGAARLTEATQRLLDRLVFARVCEDRGIANYGELRDIVNEAADQRLDVYGDLVREFRKMDQQFNGYLYKTHALSENLTVPPQLLADFVASLYPPEGPYRFDAIGDDILGIIYEQFLGSAITVRRGAVAAEPKPEVRHAGGVYYTPRFVVDAIIRRVVGPKVAGKAPLEVLSIKVLDPACGSGSFLIATFRYLIDHCTRYMAAHPEAAIAPLRPRARARTRKLAFETRDGRWWLAPEFKAQLLTSCIHGVDIDAQAVEVTIMSLYLKMLEGEFPPHWQRDWLDERLLPPLENNIRCGNSLLAPADFERYWEDRHGGLFAGDADAKFRINAFDWSSPTRGFGRAIGSATEGDFRGFDCVIGNPPYIRVQELNQWAPEECEFYRHHYEAAAKGNYDLYAVFIERGLQVLAADGLMGFICPHKFWQAAYGAGVRGLLGRGRHLRSVVDFADQQVFRGASTYTAIHVFAKEPNAGAVDYARITALTDGEAQCRALDENAPRPEVRRFSARLPGASEPWRFEDAGTAAAKQAIAAGGTVLLGELAQRMFQGIRTSMNGVFVVSAEDQRRGLYRSESLQQAITLEPGLLRPFLAGEDIRRYEIVPPRAFAIVPYRLVGRARAAQLIPAEEMARAYPKTWDYLRRNEKPLRARERGRMDHDAWYGYVYPKNLDLFGTPRILVRDIVESASFALDGKGQCAFVSGYGITLAAPHADLLPYVLGLLNSPLLDRYLKSVSTTLRGGWFRPFPQFMGQLPIKLPENAAEKKAALEIADRVLRIADAKTRLRGSPGRPALSDQERERAGREVEADEARIAELVCRLYGVDAVLPA